MAATDSLSWAVIGVGVAGRARTAAILKDPRAKLAAVWRGRYAAEAGVPVAADLDAALAAADAVAIASPTEAHAGQVRAALDAGKHVVVEFPLAPTAAEAASLFALAATRGRVLHVEHVELLDAPCQTLQAHVHPDLVESIEVAFERPGPEEVGAAELALGNVARLHRVTAIGGPVASIERVEVADGRMLAELLLVSGAPVRCTFRQSPYFARRTTLSATTPTGRWEQENDVLSRDGTPQTLLGVGSLFLRDQRRATARILDGAPPYVTDGRILHVLDVVGLLAEGRTGPVPQRSDAGAPV